MKKLITICGFLMLVSGIYAITSNFIVNGINYSVTSSNTVAVTNGVTYSGNISIPLSVVNLSKTYDVTSIGDNAFKSCSGLTSVSIPSSVTAIGNQSFYYCTGLTTITIPNSVTSIGAETFNGCSGLTSISIPNSITSIGGYAFQSCTSLTSIDIPSSITSLSVGAFYYCSGLTTLTIPSSVTAIGINAFSNCTSLTNLTCLGSTPPTLGADCFKNVTKVTDVFVATDAAVIAYKADAAWIGYFPGMIMKKGIPSSFDVDGIKYNTTSANTVEIVANSPIYTGAITIPSSVVYDGVTYNLTAIGNSAFYNCSGLTSVSIPSSVTTIGQNSFQGTGLTSLTLPSSITSIQAYAFSGCTSLTSVNCLGSTPPSLGSDCFSGTSITDVFVPTDAAVTAYKANTDWIGYFSGTIIKKNTTTALSTFGNQKVKIYTTASEIVIDGLSNATTVELYNLNGMQLQTLRSQSNESVSISSLPQGLYIVKLITSEDTIERKVLKK
jgi:hypothetical protein